MTSDTANSSSSGAMVVAKKPTPEEAEHVLEGSAGCSATSSKNTAKVLQDLARQLEYVSSKCSTVEALFGVELISRRQKLKVTCEQFMLESPKVNSVPARDRLWRYVYYDAISKAKRLKQRVKWTPLERAYVKQHLLNGIGEISLLMLKLQDVVPEFKDLKLRLSFNGLDNILPPSLADTQTTNTEQTINAEWAADLLRLLLLNIGDLCRYLTELYAKEDQALYLSYYGRAQDYYIQAFLVNPESGLAHNQLGNLSIKRNNGLDSIYYFLYSLVAKTPCQGALTNLRQLLESQLVSFATLSGSFEYKPVDTFTYNFTKILNQFFSDAPSQHGVFEKLCEDTVRSFVNLLLGDGVSVLDEGFLFRVMSICMMLVWHLSPTKTANTSSAVCFAVGMFVHLMRRLCTILKTQSKLKEVNTCDEEDSSSVEEGINEGTDCLSKSTSSSLPPDAKDQDHTPTIEIGVKQDSEGFGKRRLLTTRRRKESDDFYSFIHHGQNVEDDWNDNTSESTDYVHGSGSSAHSEYSDVLSDKDGQSEDDENHNVEEEEDFSEDDEQGYKTTGHHPDSSEVSDISYQAEIEIERKALALKLSQSSDEVISEFSNRNNAGVTKLKNVIEPENLLACWTEVEPYIVAVLPFMHWLQCWVPIQHALAASTEKEVMEEFCQLFNLLESTNWSIALRQRDHKEVTHGTDSRDAKEIESRLIRDWKNVVEGRLNENLFSLELPEDLSMLGWNHLIPNKSDERKNCITKNNMIVTRIGRILVFGQWLVGTEAFAVIRSENGFLVPSVEEYKRHMRKIQLEKFSRRLSGKTNQNGERTRRRNRENRGRRNRGYNNRRNPHGFRNDFLLNQDEKIYILVDLTAVLKYLRVIQKMAFHPKFLIVLPFSVSRALDGLKDGNEEGSKVARIANRWLERNSNVNYKNTVQLLKKEDRVSLDSIQYPSQQLMESREFFEILESCIYILTQFKNKTEKPGRFFKDARDNYRVLYLTGNKNLLDSALDSDRGFNPIATCRTAGVYLDRISRYQNRTRKRKLISNGHCGG